MSIDTSLIGRTAAELMDSLPQDSDGQVLSVGMVVVVTRDGDTYMRTKCSSSLYYEQLGLFHAALEVLATGEDVDDGDD